MAFAEAVRHGALLCAVAALCLAVATGAAHAQDGEPAEDLSEEPAAEDDLPHPAEVMEAAAADFRAARLRAAGFSDALEDRRARTEALVEAADAGERFAAAIFDVAPLLDGDDAEALIGRGWKAARFAMEARLELAMCAAALAAFERLRDEWESDGRNADGFALVGPSATRARACVESEADLVETRIDAWDPPPPPGTNARFLPSSPAERRARWGSGLLMIGAVALAGGSTAAIAETAFRYDQARLAYDDRIGAYAARRREARIAAAATAHGWALSVACATLAVRMMPSRSRNAETAETTRSPEFSLRPNGAVVRW